MRLGSINAWLHRIGLTLVVCVDSEGGPTELWIERYSTYLKRCGL